MVKVPDLYHHPDGRHWRRQPQVHQVYPLPHGSLYIDMLYIKLIPMTSLTYQTSTTTLTPTIGADSPRSIRSILYPMEASI